MMSKISRKEGITSKIDNNVEDKKKWQILNSIKITKITLKNNNITFKYFVA
jgi:hypothetical protein